MLKRIFLVVAIFSLILFVYAVIYGIYIVKEVSDFKDKNYSKKITVYDWNKRPYSFILGPKNPQFVYWNSISHNVKWAVILSEDAKFYKHSGVDYEAMKSAFKKNLELGKYVRGGSTITQQLAKNVFLSREKTLIRKLKELVIAFLLEAKLSKTRILELYLNTVEFGPLVYGIGHASHFYFGKSPSSLNPLEAALLASLLPGPKIYNPYRNMDRVEQRAKKILKRMAEVKVITEEEKERYLASSLVIGMGRKIEVKMKEEPQSFGNFSTKGDFVNYSSIAR
ncbi:MAG: biosynthetic peptidoglycan transglycosylase [bacterium]